MRIIQKLKQWYCGTPVKIKEPRESGDLRLGHSVRLETRWHWSARAIRAAFSFLAREWKWLLGFIVAILALYLNFVLKR